MLGRKVIYVRCINCSYNNVAKGIRFLDTKARPYKLQKRFLITQEKIIVCLHRKKNGQERAYE